MFRKFIKIEVRKKYFFENIEGTCRDTIQKALK